MSTADRPTVDVVDNAEEHRFEASLAGELAGFAEYRRQGNTVVFPHTVVFSEFGGQGVGSALVRGALDAMRSEGLAVVAECSFVAEFIERHLEYKDLLA